MPPLFAGGNVGCVHVFLDERDGSSMGSEFIHVHDRSLFSGIHDPPILFLHGLVESGRDVDQSIRRG